MKAMARALSENAEGSWSLQSEAPQKKAINGTCHVRSSIVLINRHYARRPDRLLYPLRQHSYHTAHTAGKHGLMEFYKQ